MADTSLIAQTLFLSLHPVKIILGDELQAHAVTTIKIMVIIYLTQTLIAETVILQLI